MRIAEFDETDKQSQRDSTRIDQLKAFVRELIDQVDKKLAKQELEFRKVGRISDELQQYVEVIWDHLDLPDDLAEARLSLSRTIDRTAVSVRDQVNELFYELILLTAEKDAPEEQLAMWKQLKNLDW